MAGELEKINEIFRKLDEHRNKNKSADKETEQDAEKEKTGRERSVNFKAVDKLLVDETGSAARNYTGDAESERDYRPIRRSQEYSTGCLGGIMYFVFIVCVSIILACLAWMAASDMLALNKDDFSAKVVLPMSIFTSETVDTFDENGKKTGTERDRKSVV